MQLLDIAGAIGIILLLCAMVSALMGITLDRKHFWQASNAFFPTIVSFFFSLFAILLLCIAAVEAYDAVKINSRDKIDFKNLNAPGYVEGRVIGKTVAAPNGDEVAWWSEVYQKQNIKVSCVGFGSNKDCSNEYVYEFIDLKSSFTHLTVKVEDKTILVPSKFITSGAPILEKQKLKNSNVKTLYGFKNNMPVLIEGKLVEQKNKEYLLSKTQGKTPAAREGTFDSLEGKSLVPSTIKGVIAIILLWLAYKLMRQGSSRMALHSFHKSNAREVEDLDDYEIDEAAKEE